MFIHSSIWSEWSHLRCGAHVHRVVHHLHLDLGEYLLLLGEYLEAHGHHVHESNAGAEPKELSHKRIHNEEKSVEFVDNLVEPVVLIVLNKLGDLLSFLLFRSTIFIVRGFCEKLTQACGPLAWQHRELVGSSLVDKSMEINIIIIYIILSYNSQ